MAIFCILTLRSVLHMLHRIKQQKPRPYIFPGISLHPLHLLKGPFTEMKTEK